MDDADRYDQIEGLARLKRLLDDDDADESDVRDAAIRTVNHFDASIAAHDDWRPYSRRAASSLSVRAEADELGRRGVEHHPMYRGRLRRRVGEVTMTITIRESAVGRSVRSRATSEQEHGRPSPEPTTQRWALERATTNIGTVVGRVEGRLVDAELMAARHLARL